MKNCLKRMAFTRIITKCSNHHRTHMEAFASLSRKAADSQGRALSRIPQDADSQGRALSRIPQDAEFPFETRSPPRVSTKK